ncbi:hypothetical protein CKAH01_13883 [Colletotrichum kahawae]|uniref:Uncharacterized protein n=1 Tax=Colletotrichum kahawae TaxID=34407 RepID=A0AAE0D9F1_COLKA|nr:hypothetical protein CKAH01_13883 [Colletotrichum kahawae]
MHGREMSLRSAQCAVPEAGWKSRRSPGPPSAARRSASAVIGETTCPGTRSADVPALRYLERGKGDGTPGRHRTAFRDGIELIGRGRGRSKHGAPGRCTWCLRIQQTVWSIRQVHSRRRSQT